MTDPHIKTRITNHKVELRADAEGKPAAALAGYAAMFGVESCEMWDIDLVDEDGEPFPFVEIIDPAAFDRTLHDKPDVRALFNHDTSSVLGRTKSGTLALSVDEVGLVFVCQIPDTQVGRDVRTLVARGDIDGCSFGFRVVKSKVTHRDGQPSIRTLLEVELFEISPAVTFPAYEQTEVALRARKARASKIAARLTPRLDHSRRQLSVEE